MISFQYRKRQSSTNFRSSHRISLLDLGRHECLSPLLLRPKDKAVKPAEKITLSPKYITKKPRISIIRAKKANISFNINNLELTPQSKLKCASVSPSKKLKLKSSKKLDSPISSNKFSYNCLNFEIHNTSKFTRVSHSPIDTLNRQKVKISIKIDDMQRLINPDEDSYSDSEERMFPKMN